ncbi:hypothetical protein [Alicyclobacillus macrosporangiidus]|uniref:hypothetical protein n=1 Tax=Alicyclobacillus macrosporangiidus TaxID=392015 RepID=UPI0012DCC18A|nr:hypothetical protein [Alicyclobacillus macrosporangiidus]
MGKWIDSILASTPSISHSADKPTKFAHLGFRIIYTFISWVVLGKSVVEGQSFFVSVFLFAIPLLMDYLKFDTSDRRWIRNTGIAVSMVWVVFSLMGLFGVLSIVSTKMGFVVMVSKDYIQFAGMSCSLSFVWWLLLSCVSLTVFDWWYHEANVSATGGKESV